MVLAQFRIEVGMMDLLVTKIQPETQRVPKLLTSRSCEGISGKDLCTQNMLLFFLNICLATVRERGCRAKKTLVLMQYGHS